MADDKTFTEDQHLAILADRVAKETAAMREEVVTVTAEKVEAESKYDAAETAKVAAEQAAETAKNDLADYKAEQDRLKTEGERAETRIATVKEAAAHMPDAFFTDEKRVARIVAMDDQAFDGYVDDLKQSAPAPGSGTGTPVPRQTAMQGDESKGSGTSTAARSVLLGRFGADAQTQTGV